MSKVADFYWEKLDREMKKIQAKRKKFEAKLMNAIDIAQFENENALQANMDFAETLRKIRKELLF